MGLVKRFWAFVERNRGAVVSNFYKQATVNLWIRLKLWRFLGRVLRAREPKTWVFMGGCYNSGTTILREMIGAHPEVASLPREGVEMTDAFPDLESDGWIRMWFRNSEKVCDVTPEAAERAKRDWSLWWQRGATAFLEKSIVHGAWMPSLDSRFPNAKFIGVIRNGYCVCEGIQRRARPTGKAREIVGVDTYPITEVGRQWNYANEVLERDSKSVKNYLEVRYEDFAKNPTETIERVFKFIGVRSNVATLHESGMVRIGNRVFDIRNQNSQSLGQLTAEDRIALWGVIGSRMTKLGYKEEP